MRQVIDPNLRRVKLPEEIEDFVFLAARATARHLGDGLSATELYGQRKFQPVSRGRWVLAIVLRETVYYQPDEHRQPTDWRVHLGEGPPTERHRPISYPIIGAVFGRHHSNFVIGGEGRDQHYQEAVRIVAGLRNRAAAPMNDITEAA